MSNNDEQTLVIIKPHAVKHKDAILRIYQDNGFKPMRWRTLTPSRSVVEEHYAEHKEASHFPTTVQSLCGRLLVFEFKGPDAIARIRALNGKTNPAEAAEGTIRKLFGGNLPFNAVHASSDSDAANRELQLWFDRSRARDTEPDKDIAEEK